jgi:hypothetical protein
MPQKIGLPLYRGVIFQTSKDKCKRRSGINMEKGVYFK